VDLGIILNNYTILLPFKRFGIVWRVLRDGHHRGVEVELAPRKAPVLVAELQVLGEVPGKARRKTVVDLEMKPGANVIKQKPR
jgi:hypothetical protein